MMGAVIDHCALEFFSLLQRKARAVLRQPAGPGGSSKKL